MSDTLKGKPWEDLPTDTSTRDLMDKDKGLTPTPTARELIQNTRLATASGHAHELATRVEVVLALRAQSKMGIAPAILNRSEERESGWHAALAAVESLLNGRKP